MHRLVFIRIESDWEKIFETCIIEKRLIIRIYKEILKINKRQSNQNEKTNEKTNVEHAKKILHLISN